MQSRSTQLGRPVAVVTLVVCGLVFTHAASAGTVLVPGLPSLPAVGFGNPMSALRVNTSGRASATSSSPLFTGDIDSFSELNTDFIETGDYGQSLSVGKIASAVSGSVVAVSGTESEVGFGRLRATAEASNSAGGFSDVQASASVDFLDLFRLSPDGTDKFSFETAWNVDGTVGGAVPNEGGASAFAALWIFEFTGGPFPPVGGQFQAQYYTDASYSIGQITRHTILGSTKDLNPGTWYWIFGRLNVSASRVNDTAVEWGNAGAAFADFSHTAQLIIQPSPGTPATAYTTASGWDYQTAIPEPAGVALLGIGAASLMARRRRGGTSN